MRAAGAQEARVQPALLRRLVDQLLNYSLVERTAAQQAGSVS
ncbi:MAG: hypothetical protein R3E79_32480 [Caldilineaceae bacterium]